MNTNQPRTVGLNDLAQLTMRANVAFAVLCARAFGPVSDCRLAPRRREQMAAVDRAIRVAAGFCQGLPGEPGLAQRPPGRPSLLPKIPASLPATQPTAPSVPPRRLLTRKHAWTTQVIRGTIAVVAAAFGALRVLAANADMFAHQVVVDTLYTDMEKLLSLAQGTCEVLGPPVDPSESGPLGPLWPAGPPACFAG